MMAKEEKTAVAGLASVERRVYKKHLKKHSVKDCKHGAY